MLLFEARLLSNESSISSTNDLTRRCWHSPTLCSSWNTILILTRLNAAIKQLSYYAKQYSRCYWQLWNVLNLVDLVATKVIRKDCVIVT
jgi:hypothetical protein